MIKWVADRRVGFIRPDNGGKEIFCDIKSPRHENDSFADGDTVNFKRYFDYQKGKDYAVDVTFSDDEVEVNSPRI